MNKLSDIFALTGCALLIAAFALLLYAVASCVFTPTVENTTEDPSQFISHEEMHRLFYGENLVVCDDESACAKLHP